MKQIKIYVIIIKFGYILKNMLLHSYEKTSNHHIHKQKSNTNYMCHDVKHNSNVKRQTPNKPRNHFLSFKLLTSL